MRILILVRLEEIWSVIRSYIAKRSPKRTAESLLSSESVYSAFDACATRRLAYDKLMVTCCFLMVMCFLSVQNCPDVSVLGTQWWNGSIRVVIVWSGLQLIRKNLIFNIIGVQLYPSPPLSFFPSSKHFLRLCLSLLEGLECSERRFEQANACSME